MRDVSDVESDLKGFMGDLKASFKSRVNTSSAEMLSILTCVDLDSLFALLCGERLQSGKVKLAKEGQLGKYDKENFEKLFDYVCSLEHVQAIASDENNDKLLFDSAFANTIHLKIKQALKKALCKEDGQHLLCWFGLPDENAYGPLQKLELAVDDDMPFALGNRYAITVQNSGLQFIADLNEKEVYRSIYTVHCTLTSTYLPPLVSKAVFQSTLHWQRGELKPWWNHTIAL